MKKKEYYSIGIMSGTSMDGFDFSFIKSDGESEIKILKNQFLLGNEIKSKLKILIGELNKNFHETIKSELFFNTEKEFELLILNIKNIRSNFIDPDVIDVIGVHGVTLIHIPQNKISIQIGIQFISDNLGKVISEFRINDLYNGGQNAPLVPVYHNAIFSSKKKQFW